MKKILIFLILNFMSLNLLSQEEDVLVLKSQFSQISTMEEKAKLPLESTMESLWFVALSHMKEQQFAQAEYDIKKILDEAEKHEIKKLTPFSISSLALFYDSLKKEETLQAQYFLKFATIFNPELPEVYLGKADFAWAQKSYFLYFFNLIKYVYFVFKNKNYLFPIYVNFLLIIFVVFLIILFIFVFFLLYKNLQKINHDLKELFEGKYNEISTVILSSSIILLPVVFGLNWFWILSFFCIIVFGYSKNHEKIILLLLVLVQVFAMPFYYYNLNNLYQSYSPIIQSAYALENKELSYKYVPDIEIISSFLDSPEIIFLLGNLYEASGDAINAIAAYKKAIAKNPTYGYAYIGLANQYFWQGNYSAAINEYLNAQKFLPSFPLLYFNLSKAYNQSLQYNKGEEALNTAMAFNARQTLKYIAMKPKKEIIPLFFSPSQAWKYVKELNERKILKGKGFRGHEKETRIVGAIFHPYTVSFSIGLILTIIFHIWRKKNWDYAKICTKCGKSFCKKCKSASESQIYCTQCIHIYIKKDGVPFEVRVKKANEVKRYLRQEHYLKKLFNLVMPGFAYLLEEKKFKGLLLIFAFYLILIYIILPLPVNPFSFSFHSINFIKKISIFILVLIWLSGNVRILIEKGGV